MTFAVAPLVGAWVEMIISSKVAAYPDVAPLVGAWVEIRDTGIWPSFLYRRSPRGSVG